MSHAQRTSPSRRLRLALERGARPILAPFLALFFPHVHAGIDWSKPYEAPDKEMHRIARRGRGQKSLADKLFKVWRLNGEEAWLLIHVEVQGEPEDSFPLRMFHYNTLAFIRYNRPVVSLAVLTDERPNWRPERFAYGDWGATTEFRFLTTKLIDWRGREVELKASVNPFTQVVLAHLRALETRQDPQGRSRYKLELVKGLYEHGWNSDDIRQLSRVIDWLLDLPPELQENFESEFLYWEVERQMPYMISFERSGLMKGLREGIAAALAAKFGKADKRLVAKIEEVYDIEKLRALLQAIPAASDVREIRDMVRGE